jgi:hypothetical protein
MMCRSCENDRDEEELTASGLCTNCIPHRSIHRGRTNHTPRPALMPATSHRGADGPGRQAVRAALAEFRERKNPSKGIQ